MAVSDEIKEQTVKLKDMTFKEKVDYIWTYYKWWIIGALALIYVVVSLSRSITDNKKPVYLNAMFLNAKGSAYSEDCTLEDEFISAYDIDMSKYNMRFDTVTNLDGNYGDQASYAGQMKLMSMYSAEELDILCAQESILSGPADVGGYTNIKEALPDDLIKELEDKGYEFYYYTEKIYDEDYVADKDEETPYTEGEKYPAGIYLDNCKTLVGNDSTCVYDASPDDRFVLSIAWNTSNLEHITEFIRFIIR